MINQWIKREIPPRYKNANIDKNIKLDLSKSWYLSGGVGSGKTHFAYALKKKSINNNGPEPPYRSIIKIINMAEFTGRIRYEIIEKRLEMIDLMRLMNFLILDDFGSESRSDFSNDVLFQILDYRYEQIMWTGFTSNFNIKDLPYESRILSRVAGIVESNKYNLKAKDRRI